MVSLISFYQNFVQFLGLFQDRQNSKVKIENHLVDSHVTHDDRDDDSSDGSCSCA